MSQTRGRSPVGRVSFLWGGGCVLLVYPAVFANLLARPGPAGLSYVAAHAGFATLLAFVFVIFFLIYLSLERAGRVGRRVWFGRLHAGATLLGVALMFAPAVLIPGATALLNRTAVAGYLLALFAQALFVLALFDAFRRRPDLR